jgi:hypothetical protein
MAKWLRKKSVRKRYDEISNRTVDNWVTSGRLPPPHYFDGSPFPLWDQDELDAADKRALRSGVPQRFKPKQPETTA